MSYYEYYRDRLSQNILYFQKDISFGSHLHRGVEIICCLNGSCCVRISGEDYRLERGDVAFIHSGLEHAIDDHGHNLCMFVPIRYLDAYLQQVGKRVPAQPVIRASGGKKLFSLLLNFREYQNCGNETLVCGYVNCILGLAIELLDLQDCTPRPSPAPVHFDLIGKITQYLSEHLTEQVTLDALAEALSYNKFYLSTTLNGALHITLKDYLNRLRMEKFIDEFDRDKSISEQIYACGFNSRQSFYRAFKRQYGCAPAQYIGSPAHGFFRPIGQDEQE